MRPSIENCARCGQVLYSQEYKAAHDRRCFRGDRPGVREKVRATHRAKRIQRLRDELADLESGVPDVPSVVPLGPAQVLAFTRLEDV